MCSATIKFAFLMFFDIYCQVILHLKNGEELNGRRLTNRTQTRFLYS